LKEKKRPELNDELAQDISEKYKTLEDLKADIRKRLEETAQNRVRSITIERLMEKVLEGSSLILPESMVQVDLENTWENFLQRNRMQESNMLQILQLQGKTKEDVLNEWRPQAEKSLKIRLLINAMIDKEKIEVADEEVENLIKEHAQEASMDPKELKAYYEKNGYLDVLTHDLKEKKLFDRILEANQIKKGPEVKFIDILQGNN